jgi:hypothetical protein
VRRVLGAVLVVASAGGVAACDRFESKSSKKEAAAAPAPGDPRERAREPLTRAMQAAAGLTASCKAGELLWEEEATEEAGPKHYSRPCIPERCEPPVAEIDALRGALADAKKQIDADPTLRVPSIEGFVSLGAALVSFIDASQAAAKSDPKAGPPAFSGLSMHYGSMAGAFAKLYDDPKLPAEPPSLTASLGAPGVGGDVCKGWGNPRYCDVTAIQVPAQHRWRASPACIEVDSVKKSK